jgi:hypothetical protein
VRKIGRKAGGNDCNRRRREGYLPRESSPSKRSEEQQRGTKSSECKLVTFL